MTEVFSESQKVYMRYHSRKDKVVWRIIHWKRPIFALRAHISVPLVMTLLPADRTPRHPSETSFTGRLNIKGADYQLL